MPAKKLSKTASLREKFSTSTDHAALQGCITLDPENRTPKHGNTIIVATEDCPKTPAMQIGLQSGTPKIHGKTKRGDMLEDLPSPNASSLGSPVHFLTPTEKDQSQGSSLQNGGLGGKRDAQGPMGKDASRLLYHALDLIRQAAELQPNLKALMQEVKKAQEAPSAYQPSGRRESYRDILLKSMKVESKAPAVTSQNTLILKVENLETFDAHQTRDKINQSLGAKKVATVHKSMKGNLVIKTTPTTTVNDIQAALPQVEKAMGKKILSAEEPKEWHRLVAHGIPALHFSDFQNEIAGYNDICVVGTPRWLCPVKEGKRAGSVVFSVATEVEKRKCLSYGLNLFGRKTDIEEYRAWNGRTQCFRCQGFGHNPKTCRKRIACGYCNKNHFTRSHRCGKCNNAAGCEHIQLQGTCVNCKGDHNPRDLRCPIVKTHRGPITTTSK